MIKLHTNPFYLTSFTNANVLRSKKKIVIELLTFLTLPPTEHLIWNVLCPNEIDINQVKCLYSKSSNNSNIIFHVDDKNNVYVRHGIYCTCGALISTELPTEKFSLFLCSLCSNRERENLVRFRFDTGLKCTFKFPFNLHMV